MHPIYLPALLHRQQLTAERMATRGEREFRDLADTNGYGLLLGVTGAIVGFFLSSLVNYNFGDGEVALVFWWLMGVAVVLASRSLGRATAIHTPASSRASDSA